ncbi:MAG: SpoIVB peptidase [Firmicutes bacterium]|nr:SpoIVB peptidase [Bacillota bacterium]
MRFRFRHILGIVVALAFGLIMFSFPYSAFDRISSVMTFTREEFGSLELGRLSVGGVHAVSGGGNKINAVVKYGFIPVKNVQLNIVNEKSVRVGGVPIGFTMYTEGVIVVGISDVKTAEGFKKPFQNSDLRVGDVIQKIGGERIGSAADIDAMINSSANTGKAISIELSRRGAEVQITAQPALDAATGRYKLGVWIRDNTAGVGTLTYVKEGGRFGALGHPITDIDTGTILPVRSGDVYNCSIVGVQKSERGVPGELKGIFLRGGKKIGTLDKNNKFGVFGTLDSIPDNGICRAPVPVANRGSVKPGKATILTTIGSETGQYDIEIIKTNYQKSSDDKSMIIKITDRKLLDKTGGIVQGMSGSPIMQNGKIVGAVTHVFLNDASKGFGVYLDWMYEE